jgi:nitrite reductase (NO-forming)
MHVRRSVVLVVGLVFALAAGALVVAQDQPAPADIEEACATPGGGTPVDGAATPETGTPAAGPAASPTACPPTGGATVAVEMIDIAYVQTELSVPANTDVTVELTNTGATVHDFVIDALGINSGPVAPGASATVTINAPAGTYEYYCSQPGHRPAGMVGTLTVQ